MNVIVKKSVVFDIIEVQGRIDGLSATDLQHAIDKCTGAGARMLVLDCVGVTYVSSAGLRVFVHTYKILSGKLEKLTPDLIETLRSQYI